MTTDDSTPDTTRDTVESAADAGTADVHGTPASSAPGLPQRGEVIIEVKEIGKSYGSVIALRDVTTSVRAGEVTCVLGDNGAGKSTFIKILAGAHEHTAGKFIVDGVSRNMNSPRAALALGHRDGLPGPRGRAADAGVAELLPRLGDHQGLGSAAAARHSGDEADHQGRAAAMGIDLRDVDQPIGTLSGGERQCVAIARAVYFGARVLILDEPTAALGRPAVRCRAEVHRRGPRPRARRHLHHAQPAPRLPGRRPVHAAAAWAQHGRLPEGGDDARRAGQDDGRRRRARGAEPRAVAFACRTPRSPRRSRPRHRRSLGSDERSRRPTSTSVAGLGVGVVGFGWMGQVHARAYLRLLQHFPTPRCGHGWSPWPTPMPAVANRPVAAYGFERAFADWQELIARDDVDVVSVCGPNFVHREIAVAAAEAGKHVWVEKPAGRNLADTAEIAAAVHAAGVQSAVGFNYRQRPGGRAGARAGRVRRRSGRRDGPTSTS